MTRIIITHNTSYESEKPHINDIVVGQSKWAEKAKARQEARNIPEISLDYISYNLNVDEIQAAARKHANGSKDIQGSIIDFIAGIEWAYKKIST